MTRQTIFDLLNGLYPTHWLAQPKGMCTRPYIVVKYKTQQGSVSNSKCGWQYIDVMVYIPMSSIAPMDALLEVVKSTLSPHVEFTGNITPDFLDIEVEAYMRSIEFRIPKEVM